MSRKKMQDLTKKRPIATAKAKKYKATYLINKEVHGFIPGQTIAIEVDKAGVPVEKKWRRRLQDAKIDNCIELVAVKKRKSKKTETNT